jgi:hypothetical protein
MYNSNILRFGTRRRRVIIFTPPPLYPRKTAIGTHYIGGWVGPRFTQEAVEKRKIFCPYGASNLDTFQLDAY